MTKVYIALSLFCEDDDSPRRAFAEAGFDAGENRTGRRLRGEELIAAIGDAEGVVAGVEPYDAATLQALPLLRCISRVGVGTDSIDLEAARRLKIAVLNTPDEVAEPVAQITVAMILALARNLPLHSAAIREGRWQRYPGFLLSEWTVGLIGFGRIGRSVERCLRPFGPRMLVADPGLRQSDLPETVHLRDLATVLTEADVVSLHAARAAADGPILGPEELKRMKSGSRVVNTSRGYLIDENALHEALIGGRLAGAALDVFDAEPYSGPLSKLPQVLCTPHVGTLTRASRRAMELKAVTNIIDFLGQPG